MTHRSIPTSVVLAVDPSRSTPEPPAPTPSATTCASEPETIPTECPTCGKQNIRRVLGSEQWYCGNTDCRHFGTYRGGESLLDARIWVELNIGGAVTVTVREPHQNGYYLVAHASLTPAACRELAALLAQRAEECERPEHQRAMAQYASLCGKVSR